jgi:hypothetical protein
MRLVHGLLLTGVLAALLLAGAVWYMTGMPGRSHRGPLPPFTETERALAQRLEAHVAGVASREHHVGRPEALEQSARYIESALAGLGYDVLRQEFQADGVDVRNIEVSLSERGTNPTRLLVIGAHYDSARDAIGANDNGSGVAALIELARALRSFRAAGIGIRLVFYVNEELPYFGTEQMGSRVHADGLAKAGKEVAAMLSLETMGYYSDAPGSQHYPDPVGALYPDTGNFIAFVANVRSRPLVARAIGSFRRHVAFPSEAAALPQFIPGVDWSDQWAYWRHGWPAVMVTDTAPFRDPSYHTLEDTLDKIDYPRLARVVIGIEGVIRDLAENAASD